MKTFTLIGILFTTLVYSQSSSLSNELKYLENNLLITKTEKDFLYDNEFETKKIYNFLIQNGINEENKYFAKQLIIGLLISKKKNYTSENYPGKVEGYPFEWWKNDEWIKKNLKP